MRRVVVAHPIEAIPWIEPRLARCADKVAVHSGEEAARILARRQDRDIALGLVPFERLFRARLELLGQRKRAEKVDDPAPERRTFVRRICITSHASSSSSRSGSVGFEIGALAPKIDAGAGSGGRIHVVWAHGPFHDAEEQRVVHDVGSG